MIELMIVIAVIGIIAAIAVPKLSRAIDKAREAEVKSALGAVRGAVSIFYADHEGNYPSTLSGDLIGGGKTYLEKLPVVTIPSSLANPGGHPGVTGEKDAAAADDDAQGGVWGYDDTVNVGSVFVNCTHADSRGAIWTSY